MLLPFILLASASLSTAQGSLGTPFLDCQNGLLSANQVCNRTLTPAARAAALVAALTPEEKLQNIISKSHGAPRIGLPAYNWWSEALHGVAHAPGTQFRKGPGEFNSSTSFPMPLLMAASFNDDLLFDIANTISIEGRAFGNARYSGIDYWTPNVNPFKDPRWGRGSETPGEDILLVKRYAKAMIAGLEGPVPQQERRVVATCKHYAANDFEDWNGATRHNFDARVSMQDLAEYYMAPFQQCARDSKVGSIMCAYNAVNGVPSCASEYLLETVLRRHWNWTEHNNYVTSDCEAVLDVSLNHKFAPTNAHGTAMSFDAGMDTSCEYESSSDIPGAWNKGLLKIETVDRALLRLYEGLVRAGYFDGAASLYDHLNWTHVNLPEAQALALQSAVEGIVLLKNENSTLPVSDTASLAMIGFWAADGNKLAGGYSGTPFVKHHPAFAALQLNRTIHTAGGPILESGTSTQWLSAALDAAKKSDYILYFGGLDTSAAGETKDRMKITWPTAQLDLINQLSKLGKPLVVIQMGDQLDDTPLFENPNVSAILWASWPGQSGGTAVMDLVTGQAAPAGRLPVTMYPGRYVDEVAMTEMALRPGDKNPGRTYRWYKDAVRGFGFGLHYTEWEVEVLGSLGNLSTKALAECGEGYADRCGMPGVKVRVENVGKIESDYVALVFVKGEVGPKPWPIKTLVGYTRVKGIKPGEKREAVVEWTAGDLARRDGEGDLVLIPGEYELVIDEPGRVTTKFTVQGESVVLEKWPKPE
ncbi:hypothetical protein OQA88_3298 [Cercophora sp. LCS_1]